MIVKNEITNAKNLGLEIVKIGHPSLRKISRNILNNELQSDDFQNFINQMIDTLRISKGVGLAAPQLGVNANIFVTHVTKACEDRYINCKESPLQVWVNPNFEITNDQEFFCMEGCLSVPGYVGLVGCPMEIKATAINENGVEFTETLTGWNARVFLHEYNHLIGRLYIDKIWSDEDGKKIIYEENIWKTLVEEKTLTKDSEWLRRHGLKLL